MDAVAAAARSPFIVVPEGTEMVTHSSVLLLRAGLVGSLILVLAAGGHVAGGGGLPRPEVMVALCAVTQVPVLILSSYRFSVPALLGLLAAGQAWLHWSFVAFGPVHHSAPALLLPASEHAGHLPASGPGTSVQTVLSSPDHASGCLMVIAHAMATVVAALLLTRAEDAVHLMAIWLKPLVQLPDFIALPPTVRADRIAELVLSPAATALRLPTRRGPPAVHPAS